MKKLLDTHILYPELNQTQLASKLGVTPPYVNAMIRKLRERGEWGD
ncbi:winged helix-turn-helix domain-containing protein (plasmid) [Paenibacillus thiaminolyticus]|nr:winged helix-turn-helix domain-containing protein [Paenibacillus thiaminolyticus]